METSIATKSNVQLIQDAFADFLSGNIPGIINICTDDIVWGSYKNPEIPFAGNFFGKEGVMEFFKGVSENINYFAFEPCEYISQDDVVAVFGHHAGTVKS